MGTLKASEEENELKMKEHGKVSCTKNQWHKKLVFCRNETVQILTTPDSDERTASDIVM